MMKHAVHYGTALSQNQLLLQKSIKVKLRDYKMGDFPKMDRQHVKR